MLRARSRGTKVEGRNENGCKRGISKIRRGAESLTDVRFRTKFVHCSYYKYSEFGGYVRQSALLLLKILPTHVDAPGKRRDSALLAGIRVGNSNGLILISEVPDDTLG